MADLEELIKNQQIADNWPEDYNYHPLMDENGDPAIVNIGNANYYTAWLKRDEGGEFSQAVILNQAQTQRLYAQSPDVNQPEAQQALLTAQTNSLTQLENVLNVSAQPTLTYGNNRAVESIPNIGFDYDISTRGAFVPPREQDQKVNTDTSSSPVLTGNAAHVDFVDHVASEVNARFAKSDLNSDELTEALKMRLNAVAPEYLVSRIQEKAASDPSFGRDLAERLKDLGDVSAAGRRRVADPVQSLSGDAKYVAEVYDHLKDMTEKGNALGDRLDVSNEAGLDRVIEDLADLIAQDVDKALIDSLERSADISAEQNSGLNERQEALAQSYASRLLHVKNNPSTSDDYFERYHNQLTKPLDPEVVQRIDDIIESQSQEASPAPSGGGGLKP